MPVIRIDNYKLYTPLLNSAISVNLSLVEDLVPRFLDRKLVQRTSLGKEEKNSETVTSHFGASKSNHIPLSITFL